MGASAAPPLDANEAVSAVGPLETTDHTTRTTFVRFSWQGCLHVWLILMDVTGAILWLVCSLPWWQQQHEHESHAAYHHTRLALSLALIVLLTLRAVGQLVPWHGAVIGLTLLVALTEALLALTTNLFVQVHPSATDRWIPGLLHQWLPSSAVPVFVGGLAVAALLELVRGCCSTGLDLEMDDSPRNNNPLEESLLASYDGHPQWAQDGAVTRIAEQRRKRRSPLWKRLWRKTRGNSEDGDDNDSDSCSVDFASVQDEWASRSEEDPLWWSRDQQQMDQDFYSARQSYADTSWAHPDASGLTDTSNM